MHKVLDIYSSVIGHSDMIDEIFMKLHKQVVAEVSFQRQIMRIMGTLDGIISVATAPKIKINDDELLG
jgi:U3 small nucleolar RNA-associated protein 15